MYDPSEALLQLGLYDYVWGDPGLLNIYNSNVQANKARQENLAYNNMWKTIEMAKLEEEKERNRNEKAKLEAKEEAEKREKKRKEAAEAAAAAEKARKEKETKLTKLYGDYQNAGGEQERSYIAKQISELEGDPSIESEMIRAYKADMEKKRNDEAKEAQRHSAALKEIAKIEAISRGLKKASAKSALAESVYDEQKYPNMNTAERDKLYTYLKGIKTLDEKITDSVENAAAAHSGKKAGEALDEKDQAAKYQKMYLENKILTPKQEQIRSKYYGAK